jgi:hypothetical protein
MTFTDRKFAIYSLSISRIRISDKIKSIYKTEDTPMYEYLMAHHIINEKRKEALKTNTIGPKVMITGTRESGKTSLCNIFINYAIKLGWNPTYVDLDLSNDIFTPGTISAVTVDFPIPNDFLLDNSISIFHGNSNNEINEYLYEIQIKEMADLVNSKLENDLNNFMKKYNLINNNNNNYNNYNTSNSNEGNVNDLNTNLNSNFNNKENYTNNLSNNNSINLSNNNSLNHSENFNVISDIPTIFASGSIINCPSFTDNSKDKIYLSIIKNFNCDIVYVIENQRLYHELNKFFQDENKVKELGIPINKIPQICVLTKSKGVASIDSYSRDQMDQKKLEIYFKGPFNNLCLNEYTLDLNRFKILQVLVSNLTQSILTIGKSSITNLILKEINDSEENLVNKVLAIPSLDERILNDLDNNFSGKLSYYSEEICKAPISYLAFM